ncbi:MAG: 1-deoxy-D-xylulose-5-phosphate reductoisomerase, partial [Burkholderiales bacterium]|nr:1-deoxy-D-xylulose-5-phosphate reductoisomerase [Burkholderiales bacterium]
MTVQRLAILGSTGSIGCSTLDVALRHPERYRIVGLSAYQRTDRLIEQCLRHRPLVAVVPTEAAAAMSLRPGLVILG